MERKRAGFRKFLVVFLSFLFLLNGCVLVSGGWKTPTDIMGIEEVAISDNRNPYLFVDEDDVVHVVWSGKNGTDFEIFYANNSGGSFSYRVVTDNDKDDIKPRLFVDSEGILYIVWQEETESGGEIFYLESSIGDLSFSEPINVSNNVFEDWNPSLFVDDEGVAHIVWQGNATGNWEIYYTKKVEEYFLAPVNVSKSLSDDMYPSLFVDSNRDIHVAWNGYGDKDSEIYYVKSSNNTNLNFSNIVNVTANDFDDYNPSLFVDSNGEIHIAWELYEEDRGEIYYIKGNSENFFLPLNVSKTLFEAVNPSIFVDLNGKSHIVWQGREEKGEKWGIYFSNNVEESLFKEPEKVGEDQRDEEFPSLFLDKEGKAHIVWQKNVDGEYKIYYSKTAESVTTPKKGFPWLWVGIGIIGVTITIVLLFYHYKKGGIMIRESEVENA
ncbi:MAG: hypothetical protein ACFE68_09610 [Candidatus Hodarchaeota archaeon]